MADLHIYRIGVLMPPHFYFQADAAMRLIFDDGEDYILAPQAETQMMHVVVADGLKLISYAGVISTMIEHQGIAYNCYGLSGVLTFPAHRKNGYGRQMIGAATQLILDEPSADIGLLWTATHNVHHYARHGWQVMPDMFTFMGDPANPIPHNDEERLMLFLSDKGKAGRTAFEHSNLYIGAESW